MLYLLAAYLPAEGWVLIQVTINGKGNEITVALIVLKYLDLRGKIATGDAMLAQWDLSVHIVEAEGDYVCTVKANQSQMRQDIEILFQVKKPVKGFIQGMKDFRTEVVLEKGHGRLE